jgi:hypothetical protein
MARRNWIASVGPTAWSRGTRALASRRDPARTRLPNRSARRTTSTSGRSLQEMITLDGGDAEEACEPVQALRQRWRVALLNRHLAEVALACPIRCSPQREEEQISRVDCRGQRRIVGGSVPSPPTMPLRMRQSGTAPWRATQSAGARPRAAGRRKPARSGPPTLPLRCLLVGVDHAPLSGAQGPSGSPREHGHRAGSGACRAGG